MTFILCFVQLIFGKYSNAVLLFLTIYMVYICVNVFGCYKHIFHPFLHSADIWEAFLIYMCTSGWLLYIHYETHLPKKIGLHVDMLCKVTHCAQSTPEWVYVLTSTARLEQSSSTRSFEHTKMPEFRPSKTWRSWNTIVCTDEKKRNSSAINDTLFAWWFTYLLIWPWSGPVVAG